MNKFAFAASGVAMAAIFATPVQAQELSYHLPKGSALGGYKWQLKQCPTNNQREAISHGSNIKGDYQKGELVRLDPRSPFLGSRKITLTYHENGTLKTINAEGEGKGGAIIASLLKTAVGLATFGLDGSADVPFRCNDTVSKQVERWGVVEQQIAQTEAAIAAGQALTGARKALYESDLKEEAELAKALTITVAAKSFDALPAGWASGDYSETHPVSAPNFKLWFDGDVSGLVVAPTPSMCVRYSVKGVDLDAAKPITASTEAPNLKKLQGRFLYKRPVSVLIELVDASAGKGGPKACSNLPTTAPVLDKRTVALPQLSPHYFTLPIGSGAFESKAVAAEFTADGRIVSMSYSGTGAGASIAEALAGGLSAAQTLRDSGVAETKREIDKIKAENELEALRKAAEAAPS